MPLAGLERMHVHCHGHGVVGSRWLWLHQDMECKDPLHEALPVAPQVGGECMYVELLLNLSGRRLGGIGACDAASFVEVGSWHGCMTGALTCACYTSYWSD